MVLNLVIGLILAGLIAPKTEPVTPFRCGRQWMAVLVMLVCLGNGFTPFYKQINAHADVATVGVEFIFNLLLVLAFGSIGFAAGWLYRVCVPFERDSPRESEKLYRKAAEQGDATAQNKLGLLYYKGMGVTQDYAEAAMWYRKAAEQGEVKSQFNLGSLYIDGHGVPQDWEEAYFWLILASTCGNKTYANLRDKAGGHLTHQQIADVQERARQWEPLVNEDAKS